MDKSVHLYASPELKLSDQRGDTLWIPLSAIEKIEMYQVDRSKTIRGTLIGLVSVAAIIGLYIICARHFSGFGGTWFEEEEIQGIEVRSP